MIDEDDRGVLGSEGVVGAYLIHIAFSLCRRCRFESAKNRFTIYLTLRYVLH